MPALETLAPKGLLWLLSVALFLHYSVLLLILLLCHMFFLECILQDNMILLMYLFIASLPDTTLTPQDHNSVLGSAEPKAKIPVGHRERTRNYFIHYEMIAPFHLEYLIFNCAYL
jgi:hypothetical protein